MKLKNKRTGEIKEFALFDGNELQDGVTLEILTKDWEDVPEEPKDFWYIGDLMIICGTEGEFTTPDLASFTKKDIEKLKEIGNYFLSREEAEKAVEKLKAWKRLKDKGFRFDPVDRYEALCGNGFNIPITATMPPEAYTDTEVSKDLDICFGGEDDN